ncbi:hypothetical protein DU508_13055 [Pedobacter chinensis]|uniref:Uncharacterized protein n=1 Tax=Pedobacter chinensis TaxID=2282421 RepID=A0A369PW99_9SPHI|nr:hypothetical protein DU508_13055 [Pedobacter chinensis]
MHFDTFASGTTFLFFSALYQQFYEKVDLAYNKLFISFAMANSILIKHTGKELLGNEFVKPIKKCNDKPK